MIVKVKIINDNRCFPRYEGVHKEHGDIEKYKDDYSPERNDIGKVIWAGHRKELNSRGADVFLVEMENGIQILICQEGCEITEVQAEGFYVRY